MPVEKECPRGREKGTTVLDKRRRGTGPAGLNKKKRDDELQRGEEYTFRYRKIQRGESRGEVAVQHQVPPKKTATRGERLRPSGEDEKEGRGPNAVFKMKKSAPRRRPTIKKKKFLLHQTGEGRILAQKKSKRRDQENNRCGGEIMVRGEGWELRGKLPPASAMQKKGLSRSAKKTAIAQNGKA